MCHIIAFPLLFFPFCMKIPVFQWEESKKLADDFFDLTAYQKERSASFGGVTQYSQQFMHQKIHFPHYFNPSLETLDSGTRWAKFSEIYREWLLEICWINIFSMLVVKILFFQLFPPNFSAKLSRFHLEITDHPINHPKMPILLS